MNRTPISLALLVSVLVLGATGTAGAQQATSTGQPERVDLGKIEYEVKCATCHGVTGGGDGPAARFLTPKPPDLTTLAKNNNGIIPVARMYEIILLGKKEASAHGTRDMPIWGKEYRIQAGEYFGNMPYDPDAYVRARILMLIEYISRLQVK